MAGPFSSLPQAASRPLKRSNAVHARDTRGGGLVSKSCLTFPTPWTVARQAPLSVEVSRQEHWSGLPFPSPGDLPDPGIEPRSTALQADSLRTELSGKTDTYVVTPCREVPALPATLLGQRVAWVKGSLGTEEPTQKADIIHTAGEGRPWPGPQILSQPLQVQAEILLEWSLNSAWERMHFAQSVTRQSSCTSALYRPVGSWLLGPTLVANESDTANSLSEKSY